MITKVAKLCEKQNISFSLDERLGDHCTFQIGGPVQIFIEPKTEEEIMAVVAMASAQEIPLLTLGKGSNILFSDSGYDGIVLHLGSNFAKMNLVDKQTIYCQSGATLVDLCRFAQENSLTGMEPLYGIPGSVGGAIFMNAGAYGGETKQVLMSTTHISANGTKGALTGEAMALSYRHSAYSDSGNIITGGFFKLQPGNAEEINAQMEDFMGRRRDKQPLEYPSAGSTFKRPEGHYASALIDECGLKGHRVGGAQVSEKHAGFVINIDHATCQDVLDLIKRVQTTVYAQTQVHLEPEIRLIGKQRDDAEWTY